MVPDTFIFKRTGMTDTFMGTLTRKSDNFKIAFDIGRMAGTHMHPSKRNHCVFFRTHTINENFAWTGVERQGSKQTVTTTIYDLGERSRQQIEEFAALLKLPADQRDQRAKALSAKGAPITGGPDPANFWAEFRNEEDLADFLLIVSTYKPRPQ